MRGFGFWVRDTVIRALGCTGWLCQFLGPGFEALRAYSVHVGDRSAGPCQYCRSPIRQLQPVQCSIVSRKFRRAGSGITLPVTGPGEKSQLFQIQPQARLRCSGWFPAVWMEAQDRLDVAMMRVKINTIRFCEWTDMRIVDAVSIEYGLVVQQPVDQRIRQVLHGML